MLDLIENARNLCQTAVNDLNSVGKEAAYQVRVNGNASCVYNDVNVQNEEGSNKTTSGTFSCNTNELSEILEKLKKINNNLGKTAGDIDKISSLDGCQDVKKIPDKIDLAQEQVTQTYNKLDKIITEVEEAEAKNKSIIDKGLKLLDKAEDFFKKIFGKKKEITYLLEDAETITTTTSETSDLPQLKKYDPSKKYDPIGELKKYQDNKEELKKHKDTEKTNDAKEEYPWLKIVEEKEQEQKLPFKTDITYIEEEYKADNGWANGTLLCPSSDNDETNEKTLTIFIDGIDKDGKDMVFDTTRSGDCTYDGYTFYLKNGWGNPKGFVEAIEKLCEEKNIDIHNVELIGFSKGAAEAVTLTKKIEELEGDFHFKKTTLISCGTCIPDDLEYIKLAGNTEIEGYVGKSGDDAVKWMTGTVAEHIDVNIIDGNHSTAPGGIVENYFKNYAHDKQELANNPNLDTDKK